MAYGTDAGFTDYFTDRGIDVSGVDIPVARVVGGDYVDARFGACLAGRRTDGYSQDNEWPRVGAVDQSGLVVPSTLVPNNVIYAAYEAGLINANDPTALNPTIALADRKILSQVDVIKWTVVGDNADLNTHFSRIDDLMAPLIDCEATMGRAPFLGVV